MTTEKIACNACGASLEVLSSANFTTCHHCGSSLAIQRAETATFTEAIQKLAAVTERLEEHVGAMSARNQLADLDRQWQLERENYMVSTKNRGREIPTKSGALAGGVFGGAFALFWTIMAFSITSMAPNFGPFAIVKVVFPLFGIGFFAMMIFSAFTSYSKADRYEQSHCQYQARREALEQQDYRR